MWCGFAVGLQGLAWFWYRTETRRTSRDERTYPWRASYLCWFDSWRCCSRLRRCMPRILCQPRTDRHRSLNTSQEWGTVNDDFVPSLPRVASILSSSVLNWYLIIRLSCSKYASNSSTQCSRLGPATVGKRRVVRSRRSQMPLFISSIKSSAMPRKQ